MKQFISWAIIKRLTKSESILLKRGIEAHFRTRLQLYLGIRVGDHDPFHTSKMHKMKTKQVTGLVVAVEKVA